MQASFEPEYRRRPEIGSEQLQSLFAAAWGHRNRGYESVLARSFTWVTAHSGPDLVGFVNVAWDGGVHFFLLDTTVHPRYQHRGIGTRLVHEAIDACRGKGEWMHVDTEEPLMTQFYVRACGFDATPAGLLSVRD